MTVININYDPDSKPFDFPRSLTYTLQQKVSGNESPRISFMPLYDFEIFATVASYRSLTRASGDLHLSQPALTQRLKSLEAKYKTKLYRKVRNGIELSDAGKLLFKYATKVLRQHDGLKLRLSTTTAATKAPSLTVGGSYSPSTYLLPSLLTRFKKSHPHIQLDLRTADRWEMERMILRGR
jgi:DNA-binding transcriptional LysR family regulator